jgi:hypothetical protein
MLEKEREKFKEEMRRMKADFAVKQQEAEKTKVEEIGYSMSFSGNRWTDSWTDS